MKKRQTMFVAMCLLFTAAGTRNAHAQDRLPLRLVQTITLPNVHGGMDHLGVDVESKRLFAAAPYNKTLEVIELKAGKRGFIISGQTTTRPGFFSYDLH